MITKQISQERYFGKLITKQATKVESQENLQAATLLSKMDVCIEKVDQELSRAGQIIKKQDIRLQKLKLIHKTLDNLEYNYKQKILKSYGIQGLDSNKQDLLMIDDSKLLNNHVKDELNKLINVKGEKIEWQENWQTLLSKIDACIEKIDQELSNAEQIIKEQDIRLHQLKSIYKTLDNLEHNYKQKIYLKDANAFISEQKENYFVHLILKKLETHRSTLDTALQILTSNKLSAENRDIKIRDLLDTTYKAENVNNLEIIVCDTFNIIHKVKKLIDNTSKTKDGDAILAQHVLEIFEKIVANLQSNKIILDYAKQNLGKSYLKLFSEDKQVDLNCSLESTKAQNTEDVPILNSKTEKLVNKDEEIADNEIIHKNSSTYLQIYNSDLKEIKSIMHDIKEIAETTEYSNAECNNAIKRAAIDQIDTCISKCDTICNSEKENQNSDSEITLEGWKQMTECTKEDSKTEQNNLNEHTTFFDKAKEAVVTVASSFFKLFLPIEVNNKNSFHEIQDIDIASRFELLDISENDTETIGEVL